MSAKSTREHLLDVGVGLMHRNGYNATGLSDILKAADVPKGSFHHHFSSKQKTTKRSRRARWTVADSRDTAPGEPRILF